MPGKEKTLCAACGETSRFKMASVYWSWYWPSGDRRAWKQWFDHECFRTIAPRMQKLDFEGICYFCGDTVPAADGINLYATVYVPGAERNDVSLSVHEACMTSNEDRITGNGKRLPDRDDGAGAPRPQRGNPWEGWGQLGLDLR